MSYRLASNRKPLSLGEGKDFLDFEIEEELRSQHLHVVGATGTGKSRFLLSLILQDIKANRGICVIDPHGELIDHVKDWLAKNEMLASRRTIRILDLNDPDWSFGFNPLAVEDDEEISAIVDQTVNGMASVMGGEDLTQTPLLRMTLSAVCTALASARLTLNEAQYLLSPFFVNERLTITETVTNPTWKRTWENFNHMAQHHPKMFNEYFQAAERRFVPFISDPSVRAILGQRENTLDLRQAMDDGEIILMDVSRIGGRVPAESSQIIARLLVNNLIAKAYTRSPKKCRPFHLYIDEVQNFLSGDIPEILSQCRKFGLHLTLSHQYLEQLRDAGELIYQGVMGTARNKVCFAVDNPDDADIMARRIFAGMTQYEMPKRSMIKPAIVAHEVIRLYNESKGTSDTDAEGEAQSIARSRSHSDSISFMDSSSEGQGIIDGTSQLSTLIDNLETDTLRIGESHGTTSIQTSGFGHGNASADSTSEGEAEGRSRSHAHSESRSEGYSEALRPIFQELPTALYSLEEQRQMFLDKILSLPNRNAFAVLAGGGMAQITTLDVPDIKVSARKKNRIEQELKSSSAIHLPRKDALETVEENIPNYMGSPAQSLVEKEADFDPMHPQK